MTIRNFIKRKTYIESDKEQRLLRFYSAVQLFIFLVLFFYKQIQCTQHSVIPRRSPAHLTHTLRIGQDIHHCSEPYFKKQIDR